MGEAPVAERPEPVGDLFGRAAQGDRQRLGCAGDVGRLDDDASRPTDRGGISADLEASRLERGEPRRELGELAALLDIPAPDVGVAARPAGASSDPPRRS